MLRRLPWACAVVCALAGFGSMARSQEAGDHADLLVKSAGIISENYLVPIPKDFLLQSGLLRMKATMVNPEMAAQWGGMAQQGFFVQRPEARQEMPGMRGELRPAPDPAKMQQLVRKIDEAYARLRQKPEAGDADYRACLDSVFALNTALQTGSSRGLAGTALNGMLTEVGGRFEQGERASVRMARYGRQYGGLGIHVDFDQGVPVIRYVQHGTAAQRADLRAGDTLVKIDGKEVKDWGQGEIVEKLRGASGTKVAVTVRREGVEKPFDVTIVRSTRNIWSNSVRNKFVSQEPKIGYVRFPQLQEGRTEDVDEAIREMTGEGMAGLIVDLRFGWMESFTTAAELADRLVAGEWSLVYDSRTGVQKEARAPKPGDAYPDVPVVVLADRSTNGPQEMLVAVVKATGRGLILGDTTAGRAVGQREFEVPGHDYRLRFSAAIYRTPKGEAYQGMGLGPDIRVEMDMNTKNRVMMRVNMEDYGQQVQSGYTRYRRGREEEDVHDIQLEAAIGYLGGAVPEGGKKEEPEKAAPQKKQQ